MDAQQRVTMAHHTRRHSRARLTALLIVFCAAPSACSEDAVAETDVPESTHSDASPVDTAITEDSGYGYNNQTVEDAGYGNSNQPTKDAGDRVDVSVNRSDGRSDSGRMTGGRPM